MIIELTLPDGLTQRIEAQEFKLVRKCECCDQEFQTTDHRQVYVNPSHATRGQRIHRILRQISNA